MPAESAIPHCVEECLGKVAQGANKIAQMQPERVLLVAAAAALAIRVVPRKWWGRAALACLVPIAEPALLALGVIKAFDLP